MNEQNKREHYYYYRFDHLGNQYQQGKHQYRDYKSLDYHSLYLWFFLQYNKLNNYKRIGRMDWSQYCRIVLYMVDQPHTEKVVVRSFGRNREFLVNHHQHIVVSLAVGNLLEQYNSMHQHL